MNLALARATAMAPGSGELDLTLHAAPHAAAATLSYAHHITDGLAASASAWAGGVRGDAGWEPDFGVMAGLRYRW